MQEIQMLLSEKQKGSSELVCAFFKSTSNFEHFQKKIILIACIFPKLQTPKDVVRQMPKKSHFRGSFDRQRGKRAKVPFRSQHQHLYHIH